jgi:hypothetical protein
MIDYENIMKNVSLSNLNLSELIRVANQNIDISDKSVLNIFLIITDLNYNPTNDKSYIKNVVDSQNNQNITLGVVVYSTLVISINQQNDAKIYTDLAINNRGLFLSYSSTYPP